MGKIANFKLLTALTIGLGLAIAAISPNVVSAAYGGSTTVNNVVTADTSPVVTGTVPGVCNDVGIVIANDSGYEQTAIFGYDPGLSTLYGSWTYDLQAAGINLSTGYYHVYVAGCWNGYEYTYADMHFYSIYITPQGCSASCVPVYRFYNFQQGAHFYTTDENEMLQVMQYTHTFRYEGIASFAEGSQSASTTPVYRFYNFNTGTHFYTSNYAEYVTVLTTAGWTYRYEGVAYYAFTNQVTNTYPVFRFYNFRNGVHFYTSNAAEAQNVQNTAGWTYRYEGIAYYNYSN